MSARLQRRSSSFQSIGGAINGSQAFPEQVFYDEKIRPVPPYLEVSGEALSTSSSPNDPQGEADAAAGGNPQSMLKRVSSFSLMSRVSSRHLPSVASSLSLAGEPPTGQDSTMSTSAGIGSPIVTTDDPSNDPNHAGNSHHSRDTALNRSAHSNGHSSLRGTGLRARNRGRLTGESFSSSLDASSNSAQDIMPSWRLRDRMKTVGVGLIMALNVGTDPPDIIKPHPCAKLQCWMDPSSVTRQKAKEKIGERLEAQYARWQQQRAARALKYRRALDPTVEDVRALCLWLRRQARQERILLHYNGHGVPRPTSNGEIWVFDKNHTEYIPLSVSDLKQWMGKPTIVVLDCSSAGILIPILTTPLQETPPASPPHSSQQQQQQPQQPDQPMDVEAAASHWVKDTIVLCPTAEGEWLPMHPDYPADIFTSCLTTPIQMALRWFVRRNSFSMGALNPDAVDAIPGQANDRKTPLGELNWIFTAVTDSIAWNVLPKPLFQRLFRQDLLVASMFRNFLLADRILRSLNCTPQSYPPLPPGIADHPLWQAWDLACETCLFGLLKDGILGNHVLTVPAPGPTGGKGGGIEDGGAVGADGTTSASPSNPTQNTSSNAQSQSSQSNRRQQPGAASTSETNAGKLTGRASSISSPFFSEQLTAFEIWLEYAERHKDVVHQLESPEQLPVVLQVLLSQVHRIRALELLKRFLEVGPWAVNLSLSLGIFPYVMKLLQSPEYISLLVSIWACILKFDPSCQVDLVKDGAVQHFIQPLANWANPHPNPPEAEKQRTLAAFSLAATCYQYPQAQTECLKQNLHGRCAALLTTYSKLEEQYKNQLNHFEEYQQQPQHIKNQREPALRPEATHAQLLSPMARAWLCICLGNLAKKFSLAQREVFHINAHNCVLARLQDEDPHVRASAAYSLGCLMEYVQEPPPPMPPAMSLGPGIQGLPAPTFQPGQQILVPQPMSATTMTVPAALTASAVLSGQLQPTMGQSNLAIPQQPTTGATPLWPPPQAQGASFLGQPGQVQLGPMQAIRGGPTQLQTPVLQQLQPQGARHLQPQQMPMQPIQPMQPTQPMQHANRLVQQPALMPTSSQPMPGQTPVAALRLNPGQPVSASLSLFSQQNMLRPQGGALIGGSQMIPQGVPPSLMGATLGHPPSLLMNQLSQPELQQNMQAHLSRRPTVFEDQPRMELDLAIVEALLKSLADGSAIARYETLMALSNFVEKYMKAFIVVAEQCPNGGIGVHTLSSESAVDEGSPLGEVKSREGESNLVIPVPNGLNNAFQDRFAACWQALLDARRVDAHPVVVQLATDIVRVVHERLLDVRVEIQARKSKDSDEGGLSGIAEEDSDILTDQPLHSQQSAIRDPPNEIVGSLPRPTQTPPKNILRRTSSDQAGMQRLGTKSSPRKPVMSPQNTIMKRKGDAMNNTNQYKLPKSSFYDWKRASFNSNLDHAAETDADEMDPLNPNGAACSFQHRRNLRAREMGRKLAERFVTLKPKPPQRKKELDLILEDSDEDVDDKDSALKVELKLREDRVLQNRGVKMTSMLKFHSYEDVLMVCDDHSGISVWDYEKGCRNLSFQNGNPKGSRMTSSFWINEQAKSLFFVGCDDGSARVWAGIVEDDGEISSQAPTLSAAFTAAPDMEAGRGGSGLVCEWQQYSGSLVAGGHSKYLRCWDLVSEKCRASFETGKDAIVTALATAWDEDLGVIQHGYSGMGPDVVVAGHSNGSLKLFDIRSPNAVGLIKGRRRKYTNFKENDSWIVGTSFTSYGGSYEILSGSMTGDIRAWDLRTSGSLRVLEAQRSPMTALAIHRQIPIAATGSHAQFIKVNTLDGEALQVARFHESGHRIGPVSCLEFHKQKLFLATGATNALVSIYKPKHASPLR